MSIISHFKGKISQGDNGNASDPPRPVGDRLLDRLTTSTYLLPIAIIGGAIWYLGYSPLYLGALAAGVVVWAYWGRRMTMADGKLALVVNVETGEIAPYVIGRTRWARATKTGRPYLSFRTPAGLSVEVIQEYDPAANAVTYPPAGVFSDVYIASIPDRYGELIDQLTKLTKENMTDKTEIDLKSVEMARAHNARLSKMIDDLLVPKEAGQHD